MNVDVVITGLDAENHILECVEAVQASNYHKGELRLRYVDLGSSDSSVLTARRMEGLDVLHGGGRPLGLAEARNLGWKRGKAPAVVFLDARSRLDPEWIETAVVALDREVGAVTGPREVPAGCGFWTRALTWEDWPRQDVDDPLPARECLVRRKVLRAAHGLDQTMEPESMADLGAWMLDRGWLVVATEEPFCRSDPPRVGLAGFLGFCVLQGAALADVRLRLGLLRRKVPGRVGAKAGRAVVRCSTATVFMVLGMAGLVGDAWQYLPLLPMGAFLALYPRIWLAGEYATQRDLNYRQGNALAWARCVAGFPWAAGYLLRILRRPWRMVRRPRRPGSKPAKSRGIL